MSLNDGLRLAHGSQALSSPAWFGHLPQQQKTKQGHALRNPIFTVPSGKTEQKQTNTNKKPKKTTQKTSGYLLQLTYHTDQYC